MAPAEHEASETSPLLQSERDSPINIAINGTIETGAVPDGTADVGQDGERRESIDESRAAQFSGNREARKMLKYIVPAVSIGVFLSAADQTIIVSSYGRIGSDLEALNLTSWIGTSYFLTLSSFQPLYGKLSDIFGRKLCLLIAYAIFGLGCLFCGLAQDIGQLIAARVFQGIGGGGMTTVVSIMFSDIVPLKDRGVWQGLINIVYASGAAAGAPLGGLLADYVGWRWAFLAQAPICLLAFIAAALAIKLPHHDQSGWRKKLSRIDFPGATVLVCAVFGLIFGLDRGSNKSWLAPISYAPISLSLILFALFIYLEMHVAKEPFAPGHVIFERGMFAPFCCNFFSFSAWMSALFYMPLYFQAVDGLSATRSALHLLPAIVAGVSGSLFAGVSMKRTGKFYWLTVFAYTILPLGLLIILLFSGLVSLPPHRPDPDEDHPRLADTLLVSLGMTLAAFGNGIGVTSSLIALIANAAPEDQAVATACSYLFRSLGSVVGLSLSATVIQQKLREALREALSGHGRHDADEVERGVRRSLAYIRSLDPELRRLVRRCYGRAVRNGYGLMIAIALGAMVSAYFIRERRLSR